VPRQSAAAKEALNHPAISARLVPPSDLDQPERELFLTLVLAVPPSHFTVADEPLLSAFVRACVLEKTAAGELSAAGYVIGGKPNGWLSVWKEATRTMTVLSRLLRLNPIARPPVGQEPSPSSYYERISLEARDEPEPN
jgi:hypothetical protein